MAQSIDAILKKAKPRETTVPIYMAGDLVAELERLERQLAEAGEQSWDHAPSLTGDDPTRAIAQKIAATRQKLKASEVEFRFRALPDWSDDPAVTTWSDLLAVHAPKNENETFNADTFPRALISACCVDPVMSPEQVDQLNAVLNQAQRNELFEGAFSVNTEGTQVPFSVTASGILASLTDGK